MKGKLENLLAEVNEVEAQLEGVVFLLEILKEHFEYKNQMELFYMVQLLDEFTKNRFETVRAVAMELDEIIMHIRV